MAPVNRRESRPGPGWSLALGAALLAAPLAARAESLPNFDIQRDTRGTTLANHPDGASVKAAIASRAPGLQVKFDALTGTANRVSSPSGPLTGPSRRAPETVSRRFVADHPELYHLKDAEVAALYTEHQAFTESMGVTNLELGQQLNGIPVFKAGLKLHVSDQGELLTTSGAVVPQLGRSVTATVPRLGPGQALAFAARHAGLKSGNLGGQLTPPQGARAAVQFGCGDLFEREPVVQLSYFPVAKGKTALAWDTVLWLNSSSDVYHILVDASTGALLFRNNYTHYASGTVFAKEAPQSELPFTTNPGANIARVSKPFDGTDPFFGTALYAAGDQHINWWAGAAPAATNGNNCLAGSARTFTFPEGAAKPTAVAGAAGVFNFPVDLTQDPTTYQNAAVANLFYWNNRCHDIWYKFGFTEAFRNFQNNNFGLGGVGNDATVAMAQYDANGASRNNANFSTPSDGANGRMRMFVFDITNPQRDGDFSADVIVHEYGHGVSNRIIGNGNGLDADQSGAMGEGWSDFQGLMVLVEQADSLAGNYPIGGYVINSFSDGIRNQPYSTNSAVFNETYGQIDTIGGRPFEVHNAGEVICNALWQTHGRLATRLGVVQGRLRTMQLLISAFKLTPNSPTFLDFRNALLLADQQTFQGADHNDIWAAFASRGMGFSASTDGPNDHTPTEAFDLPPVLAKIKGRVTQGASGLGGVTVTAFRPGTAGGSAQVSPNTPIPDNNATGITSTLNVPVTGILGNVVVHPTITHTYRGDLKLTLIHPDGTRNTFKSADINDSADNVDADFTVNAFAGKPANGAWKLEVVDSFAEDTGTLNSWKLTIPPTSLSKTATTLADGNYTINDVPAGSYTVTPTKSGVSFTPVNRPVTVSSSDVTGVNFAASGGGTTFSVSGKVIHQLTGLGVANVQVKAGSFTATTNSTGAYLLNLPAGSYSVTCTAPAATPFVFSPASVPVTVGPARTGVNFEASPRFSLSGRVTRSTNAGLAGTTLRLTGAASTLAFARAPQRLIPDNNTTGITEQLTASAPAGATLTGVQVQVAITHPHRGDLSVTLVHPSGTSVVLYNGPRTDATANLNVTFPTTRPPVQSLGVLNGKAAAGVWKLVVKDLATGSVGTLNSWKLTLNFNHTTNLTATSINSPTASLVGNYAFSNLLPGTYKVTPAQSGRTFTPAFLTKTLGPNATGVNFKSNQP